jgi:hypothetical protein
MLSSFVSFALVLSVVVAFSAEAGDDLDPENVVSVLRRDPGPGGAIVLEEIPESRLPLDLTSSRLLYEDKDAAFWVLKDTGYNVCLITNQSLDSGEWAAALSCAEPSDLKTRGLWLRLTIKGAGSDVTLIADGATNSALRQGVEEAGGWLPVDNLVMFPLEGRPTSLVVDSAFGVDLDLGREAQP